LNGSASSPKIPLPALALGIAGLIPFIACTLSLVAVHAIADEIVWRSLQAYGAVILSFLGAVHWGAAIVSGNTLHLGKSLGFGVLPCLLGWAVLSIQPPPGGTLALLMLGFTGQFVADRLATDRGLLPPWYLDLRRILTVLVLTTLGLIFVFSPVTAIGR